MALFLNRMHLYVHVMRENACKGLFFFHFWCEKVCFHVFLFMQLIEFWPAYEKFPFFAVVIWKERFSIHMNCALGPYLEIREIHHL